MKKLYIFRNNKIILFLLFVAPIKIFSRIVFPSSHNLATHSPLAILGDFACRPSEACVRRTKWQILVRDYFVNGVDGVV